MSRKCCIRHFPWDTKDRKTHNELNSLSFRSSYFFINNNYSHEAVFEGPSCRVIHEFQTSFYQDSVDAVFKALGICEEGDNHIFIFLEGIRMSVVNNNLYIFIEWRGLVLQTFIALTSEKLIAFIKSANHRIVFLSPGISKAMAEVLVNKKTNLNIEVIIDSDPEVCRLGYGEIEGVDILIKAGVEIRKTSSLRLGVLIVDENAWIFSPVPLIVEEEPKGNTINAITVNLSQANELIASIMPSNGQKHDTVQLSLFADEPQIAREKYTEDDLSKALIDLIVCPPKRFDFERRVRTYSSFVQFVELKLTGIYLNRRTVQIPSKLLNVRNSKEVQERLKTTYRLIDENSKISGKEIEDKVHSLRKKFTRSMGSRLGTVILRNVKEEFLIEVKKIEINIINFTESVRSNLEKDLQKTKNDLIEVLLPAIRENPPDELRAGITTKKPTKEIAKQYLNTELSKVIPKVDLFLDEMKLYYDFKDVTYEMLNDQEFQNKLRDQYPYVNWPKPFEEKEALEEKRL